jgi:hypothetical protein
MDPDYRALLLAVVARIEQLIAEVDVILLEASEAETVDGTSVLPAELRRVLMDWNESLTTLQDWRLNCDQRNQSSKVRLAPTGRAGAGRAFQGLGQWLSTQCYAAIARCLWWLGIMARVEVSLIGQLGMSRAAFSLPSVPPEKRLLLWLNKSTRCSPKSFGKRKTWM